MAKLIHHLFFCLALLSGLSLSVWAQPAAVTGQVVGVEQATQPCLTPDERTAIQQTLQTKLATLNKNQPPSARLGAHPAFGFPLRWTKSRSPYGFWTISNYVDLNPALGPNDVNQYSASNLDYACGNRTYDQKTGYQHQGTDIALWPFDWSVMTRQDVKVVAAAAGVIIDRADGNDDQSCGSFATASTNWNAVYVRHDDGSVAWYGHLKKGSVTTKAIGERVAEGELLGFVGSSGRSSGPHLHFEVYDATGKLIDPFAGACNHTTTESWWKEQPAYKEKVLNRLSVHTTQPVTGVCPPTANITNEVVIAQPGQRFYFYAFGRELEPGDAISFQVYNPAGQLFTYYQSTGTASYQTFYWYMYTTIPITAVEGKWKLRVRFNGKDYDKTFVVATNLPDAVKLTVPDKLSVCKGQPVTLTAGVDSDDYVWKKDGVVIDDALTKQLTVSESGVYTVELGGLVSNPVSISVATPAGAGLTGNQAIYEGGSAKLSVALTGDSPWTVSYRDSTATGLGSAQTIQTAVSPYELTVKPARTTAYFLTDVSNVCGHSVPVRSTVVVTVSPLLAVEDQDLADAVDVYPVPVASSLTVRIAGLLPNQLARLELTDAGGRVTGQYQTRRETLVLPLDQYPAGTYILRIKVGDRTASKRILKL